MGVRYVLAGRQPSRCHDGSGRRRDFVFNTIELLADLRKLCRGFGFQFVDPTRKVGNRGLCCGLQGIEPVLQSFLILGFSAPASCLPIASTLVLRARISSAICRTVLTISSRSGLCCTSAT